MSKTGQFSIKNLFILAIIGFLIYYSASRWVGFDSILSVLLKSNPIYIFLAFLLEISAYIGTGYLLYSIFNHLGVKSFSFLDTFRLGTITAISIHSLPISVFGEAVFNYYLLRKKRVLIGNILAMLLTRLIFSYSAFFLILGLGLLAMPVFKDVSLAGKIASITVFLILIIGIILARNLYLNFERFRIVFGKVINLLDHFKKIILNRARLNQKQKNAVIEDIHNGFSPLDSPRLFIRQTLIAAIYWLGDIGCLFLVIFSLGTTVNPIKLIIAYGIATTLGAISFIPGGIGVIEGSLGLMLVNIGLPVEIAVLSVIGYRLISFWLMIPIGFYSAIKLNYKNETKKQTG